MMTKLRSGQGKRDDADADAADQSNTYMSPFQATQKVFNVPKISIASHGISFLNEKVVYNGKL